MPNILKDFWPKKWPTKKQWKKLPEVLSRKEKIILLSLVFVMIFSFLYTSISFYHSRTEVVPGYGGIYREGFIESTKTLVINPLYASQSETDRDIIEVVFEGLMTYDKNGNIVSNLALGYGTNDNKVFKLTLRNDIYWSDGEKITTDDIIYTIKTIQNSDFQSTLRQRWIGVEIRKASDYEIYFILEEPSSIFPENLTLKIIPKHIFEGYSPREFRYSEYNLKPVGSGPYRFKDVKFDSSGNIEYFLLERNPYYFKSSPYLDEVSFHFFRDIEELLRAQRRAEIDGFVLSDNIRRNIEEEELEGFVNYRATLPRYFSVFFNLQREGALQDASVRKALKYATNKNEFINTILAGKGSPVNSPLLLDFYNFRGGDVIHEHNLEKAREILKDAGFEDGRRETEDPFVFTEDTREGSQGEEVRNLQRCFLYLQEKDEDIYPDGEVTGFFDEKTKEATIYFQEKYREEILDPQNFRHGTGMVAGSTQEKLNELCEGLFNKTVSLEFLVTTLDDPMLMQTAQILKRQWERLGIVITIEAKSASELKEEVIRTRNFDALLSGTMLSGIVNPLPMWHSTKIDDPGFNLSGYENEEVDRLLEKTMVSLEEERENALLSLQEIILEDVPAIFLYNPDFLYSISERVMGIEERVLVNSSQRFLDIDKWYVNTKRLSKNN